MRSVPLVSKNQPETFSVFLRISIFVPEAMSSL